MRATWYTSDMQTEEIERLITTIQNQYGLQIIELTSIGHELHRNVYKVQTNTGIFIFKISHDRKEEQLEKDAEFLKFLEKNDFPAPRLILTHLGNYAVKVNNTKATLTSFIQGIHPDLNEETIYEIGKQLGLLHSIDTSEYPHEVGWDIVNECKILKNKYTSLNTIINSEIIAQVIEKLEKLPTFYSLPKTLIHTDIHPENTIVTEEDTYYFIDWDDAGIGTSILDLGYVLSQVCIGYHAKLKDDLTIKEDLMISFLKGYQEHRVLSNKEKENLIYAMQACALLYTVQYWIPKIDMFNWERYLIEEKNKDRIVKLLKSVK